MHRKEIDLFCFLPSEPWPSKSHHALSGSILTWHPQDKRRPQVWEAILHLLKFHPPLADQVFFKLTELKTSFVVWGKELKWRHCLCLEFVWINSLSEGCFLSEKENSAYVPRFSSPGPQNNALCRVSARGVSVDELMDKGPCSSILLVYSMILLYEEKNYSLMKNEGIISLVFFIFNDSHFCHLSYWEFLLKPYWSVWFILHTMYLFSFCPICPKFLLCHDSATSHQIRYMCVILDKG